MENIQRLLQEINEIRVHHEAIIEATGERFNIFKIVGVNHYENKHSAIIAEFLNPFAFHGLKEEFLCEFINQVITEGFPFDCENACVQTEVSLDEHGRADIVIEQKDKKKAIIIENKICARDQNEQLNRYDAYARNKYSEDNYRILYLTLEGTEASKHGCCGVVYIKISYSIHIINWMEKCAKISLHYPMVRETINQYINHLKQLTNQDMETTLKEDIIRVITQSSKNVKSAIYIGKCIEEAKRKILDNFVNKIANELHLERLKLDSKIANEEFGFIYSEFYLYFGKNGVETYVSIKTEESLYGSNIVYVENKLDIFDKKCDAWNPFGWSVIFRNHWGSDPEVFEFMLMDDSELKKEIIDWIEKMKNTIDTLPLR